MPQMVLERRVDDIAGHQRVYVCPRCEIEVSVNFPPRAGAEAPPHLDAEDFEAIRSALMRASADKHGAYLQRYLRIIEWTKQAVASK
jgi:hypothetical protein